MKNLLTALAFALLPISLVSGRDKAAQLPEMDIYLCIGQSNMAGRGELTEEYADTLDNVWLLNSDGEMEPASNPLNKYSSIRKDLKLQGVGPAWSFAGTIADETGNPVGLVVNARGGSSIDSWLKGSEDGYYEKALERVRQALKYGTLKAVIWHQGETDVDDPQAYLPKLCKFVADLREDLGQPELPFVLGELAQWLQYDTAEEFNEMLRSAPGRISRCACVSSEDLTPLRDENDPHFDAPSQIVFGQRYAEAVLMLLQWE